MLQFFLRGFSSIGLLTAYITSTQAQQSPNAGLFDPAATQDWFYASTCTAGLSNFFNTGDYNGTFLDSYSALWQVNCGQRNNKVAYVSAGTSSRGISACFRGCDKRPGCTGFSYVGNVRDSTYGQGVCWYHQRTLESYVFDNNFTPANQYGGLYAGAHMIRASSYQPCPYYNGTIWRDTVGSEWMIYCQRNANNAITISQASAQDMASCFALCNAIPECTSFEFSYEGAEPAGVTGGTQGTCWFKNYAALPVESVTYFATEDFATRMPPTATSTTVAATGITTAAACPPTPTLTYVTFRVLTTTSVGQTMNVVGSISQLGSWSTGSVIRMNSDQYSDANPVWYVTIELAVGTTFEYKYIRREANNGLTWEDGNNRVYTVPGNCDGASTISDTAFGYVAPPPPATTTAAVTPDPANTGSAPYPTGFTGVCTTSGAVTPSTPACPAANTTQFTSPCGSVYTVYCGFDNTPSSVTSVTAANLPACMAACDAYAGCQSASLQGTTCYIKTGFTALTANSGLNTVVRTIPPNPAYRWPPLAGTVNASTGCNKPLWSGLVPDGTSQSYSFTGPDGYAREYRVHIPRYYNASRASPIIFGYSGRDGDSASIERDSKMSDSVRNPFGIAVYVTGVGRGYISNPSFGPTGTNYPDLDDVSFMRSFIPFLTDSFCIDTGRIWVTGYSNGGGLVQVLACDPYMSSIISVFTGMSAAMYTNATSGDPRTIDPINTPVQAICAPSRNNIAYMEVHGLADGTIAYGGGVRAGRLLPEIPWWASSWAVRQGYTRTNSTLSQGTTWIRYGFGNADNLGIITQVTLTATSGSAQCNHCWSEGAYQGFDASTEFMNFFYDQTRSSGQRQIAPSIWTSRLTTTTTTTMTTSSTPTTTTTTTTTTTSSLSSSTNALATVSSASPVPCKPPQLGNN